MADDTEKTPEKQVTHRTPKGVEKQLDYILVDRKHMCCSRHALTNDMIHMGSDHRSVMAQFVTTAPKKQVSQKTHRKEENPNSRDHKESRRWKYEIWGSKHVRRALR